MKVDVITRHSVANYGSILQSYATQKAIEGLGHECEIIDYTRYDEQGKNKAKTLCKNSSVWNKNSMTRFLYYIIQTPNYLHAYNKFKKYRAVFLKQTKEQYSNIDELKANPPKADVYCAGSDQIWGKIGTQECDSAYYLDFVPDGHKCISYAASIGRENVSSEIIGCIKAFLPKYSSILVRENSAVDIIKKAGIENAELVLDPTLLLDKNEWEQISSNVKIHGKYVLVYQLHNNKKFERYIKEFSKRAKIPVYRICPSTQSIIRGGKPIFMPTPQQFITYFKNAEYVITDSFHGTVFSIIFNKKFIDILPKDTGTRITNILGLVNLKERILGSYDDFSYIGKDIDYKETNQILDKQRKISIEKLRKAIEE